MATNNAGQKWSEPDEVLLIESYKLEKPIPEIAELLGRTEGGIRSRLKVISDRKWSWKQDELLLQLHNEGISPEEIAELMKVQYYEAKLRIEIIENKDIYHTGDIIGAFSKIQKSDKELWELATKRVPPTKISEMSGKSTGSIARRLATIVNSMNYPNKMSWSTKQDKFLLKLRKQGDYVAVIAAKFKRSIFSIQSRLIFLYEKTLLPKRQK